MRGPGGRWISEAWQFYARDVGVWAPTGIVVLVALTLVRVLCAKAFGVPIPMAFLGNSQFLVGGLAREVGTNQYLLMQVALSIFSGLLSLLFYTGMFKMALRQMRGEPIVFSMLFSNSRAMFPFFQYALVLGLVSLAGAAICIVPGVIALALLAPGLAMVIDRSSVGPALSASVAAVKRDWLHASLWMFVFLALLFVGTGCTLGIGGIVFGPLYVIFVTIMYRDMVGMDESANLMANSSRSA